MQEVSAGVERKEGKRGAKAMAMATFSEEEEARVEMKEEGRKRNLRGRAAVSF